MAPGEEDPWLFGFPRCLSTGELWRMGFAQALLLNAAGWSTEVTAAAEISGALKAGRPLKSLGAEHREDLESAIAPAFLGGDVIIVVACQALEALPDDDRARCVGLMSARRAPTPIRPPALGNPPPRRSRVCRGSSTASAPCGASMTRWATTRSAQ